MIDKELQYLQPDKDTMALISELSKCNTSIAMANIDLMNKLTVPAIIFCKGNTDATI